MGLKEQASHYEDQSQDMIESFSDDSPLYWSWLRKNVILLQCAFYALGPGFTSAILIPGINQVAEDFNVSAQKATYLVAVHVLFLGLGPFFWIPCMHAIGRRPVLVASVFLSCVASIGGGFTHTFGSLMTARVFQSFGVSAGFVLPGVVVVDLFPAEKRGRKNGIWAQMIPIGPSLGGLIGGPVCYYVGWRWVLWLNAIMNGVQTVGFLLTCPETSSSHRQTGYRRLDPRHFFEPFLVLQVPQIVLVAFAHGVTFAVISVGLSTIIPIALTDLYGFGPVSQGLFFLAPLIGTLLAEQIAGPISDWVMNRERQRASRAPSLDSARLEQRLLVGLPGFILALGGVLIFGFTLQNKTHWIGPCMGYAIASFGLQVVTTPIKTYSVDCLSNYPGSTLQLINIVRQIISFTVPFWSPNLGEKLGYALGYGIEAILIAIFALGCLLALWKGAAWRKAIQPKGLVGG